MEPMGNDTRNQHFVPRAVLRGFLARKTKRDEYAWAARRTGEIFCGNIEGIGAARDFYSDPPSGQNELTLDRTITSYETHLAELLKELREVPVGGLADSATSAEVIGRPRRPCPICHSRAFQRRDNRYEPRARGSSTIHR